MIFLHVDQIMLDDVWNVMHNTVMRNNLKFIGTKGSFRYTDIKNYVNTISKQKTSVGRTAYYLRIMTKANVVKIDSKTKTYLLTRIGCRSLSVIKHFEAMCSKYDLDDCDADGRVLVKMIVKERVL